MDGDLKTIKYYLEMALRGRPMRIEGDVAAEISSSFESLSNRLEALEIAERRRQPMRSATPTPEHGLGAVGGE